VGTQNKIDVTLVSSALDIDEVMVVAYGTATKESFTGSALQVNSESIEKKEVSNINEALAGEIAGVQVINSSGQPGSGASIYIRGIGSLSASSAPLYVVDGMPYDGSISSINPSDIESTTVLKDASASALYGARGANGVILITTKKGKEGTKNIELDVSYGVNMHLIPDYDVIDDPQDYYQITWEGIVNREMDVNGLSPSDARQYATDNLISELGGYNNYDVSDDQLIDNTGTFNPNANLLYHDDWYDELFQASNRTEANLKMSGGANNTNYYSSFGYLKDVGYYKNSGYERFSGRINLNQELKPWLKSGANLYYAHSQSNVLQSTSNSAYLNGFMFARNMPPIYPVYVRNADGSKKLDDDGNPIYDYSTDRKFGGNSNAVGSTEYDKNKSSVDQFSGRANIEVKFLKDFKFKTALGVDLYSSKSNYYGNPTYGSYADQGGYVYESDSRYFTYTANQLLEYDKTMGSHHVNALIGHEFYNMSINSLSGGKSNLAYPDNYYLNNAVVVGSLNSYLIEHQIESYLGLAKYDFEEKYFANFSIRRDATSRFPDDPWGTFWSVGGAWLLDKEDFFDVSFVDMLKLKASYGVQGNESLTNYYPTFDQYEVVNSNDAPSFIFSYKGNKDLTWETSTMLNAGVEFTLWDRLDGEIELYSKNTSDLLYYRPVSPSQGYSSIPVNDMSMRNSGVEFTFNYQVIENDELKVSLNVNGGHYKNVVTEMPHNTDGSLKTIERKGRYTYEEGRSIYDYYMPEFVEINPDNGMPVWKIAYDENGEYVSDVNAETEKDFESLTWSTTEDYDSVTQVFLDKTAIPVLQGGFGLDVDYKAFELSLQFMYSLGGYGYDDIYQGMIYDSDPGTGNYHKDILNRWQQPGDITNIAKLSGGSNIDMAQRMDLFLVSRSYLNLSSAYIAYNLPKSVLDRLNLQSAKIFASGSNLFLLSARDGYIPYLNLSGSTSNVYSPLSSITGGISIKF